MTLAAPARRCRVTRPRPAARTPRDDTSPRRRAATPRHDAAPRRLAATPRHDAAPRRLAAAPRRDGLIVFVFSRRACAWAGVSIGVSRDTYAARDRAIGKRFGLTIVRSVRRHRASWRQPRVCRVRVSSSYASHRWSSFSSSRGARARGPGSRSAYRARHVCGARSGDWGAVWSRDRLVGASAPCLVTSLSHASRARHIFVWVTWRSRIAVGDPCDATPASSSR